MHKTRGWEQVYSQAINITAGIYATKWYEMINYENKAKMAKGQTGSGVLV